MSALTLDHILTLFEEYVRQTGQRLNVLLIGRLALYAYGSSEARTDDVDAELAQMVCRPISAKIFPAGRSCHCLPVIGIVPRSCMSGRIFELRSWNLPILLSVNFAEGLNKIFRMRNLSRSAMA